MALTETQLRNHIARIFDEVLETGRPMEIEWKGQTIRIVPGASSVNGKLARLVSRDDAIIGDPEDLVEIDWSSEWKP